MADELSQPPVSHETLLRIGPILIGSLLSWMLLGISIVQLYIYHVSFRRERFAIMFSVYTIFALDVFQSIVVASDAWQSLCAGWGRPINLQYPGWTFTGLPIVSSVISVWVQVFYAWRIWQLSKWRAIPIMIIITGLAQAGAACAIAISFIWLKDIDRLHDTNMFARTIVWLGGSAFTDITIMLSMCYLLYSVKQRTKSFERSGLMINKLIRLTVETGCACALSAVLELAFFLGLPDTSIHLIFALCLSKVYSNTLMTSLNSRAKLGGKTPKPEYTGTATTLGFRHVDTHGHSIPMDTELPPRSPVAVNISKIPMVSRNTAETRQPDDKLPRINWDMEMNDVSKSTGGKEDIISFSAV